MRSTFVASNDLPLEDCNLQFKNDFDSNDAILILIIILTTFDSNNAIRSRLMKIIPK